MIKIRMKSLKDCYINFTGSGNPDADLRIFGFEQGGDVLNKNQQEYNSLIKNGTEEELLRHSQNYSYEPVGSSAVYSQIFNLLTFFEDDSSHYYENNNRILSLTAQSNIFYSNLYLLKWPCEVPNNNFDRKKFEKILIFYNKYFYGLKTQTWERRKIYTDQSLDWVLERGKRYFHNSLKNSSSEKIIFILKKGYEGEYLRLLNPEYSVSDIKEIKTGLLHRNNQICIKYLFKDHLIIFLPNGLSDKIKLESILIKLSLEDQRIKYLFHQRLMNNLLDEQ
jgi:hypothetical protein